MSKSTVRTLKKRSDRLICKYVRLMAADGNGMVTCVTCGSRHHWQNIDGGHFIPKGGGRDGVRYDVRNIHPQCTKCNRYVSGNWVRYFEYMKVTFGIKVIDELIKLSHEPTKFTIEELKKLNKTLIAGIRGRASSLGLEIGKI